MSPTNASLREESIQYSPSRTGLDDAPEKTNNGLCDLSRSHDANLRPRPCASAKINQLPESELMDLRCCWLVRSLGCQSILYSQSANGSTSPDTIASVFSDLRWRESMAATGAPFSSN